jgi:hypothetical protein
MPATKELNKYFLERPGQYVAVNLHGSDANTVTAQIVSGEGKAQVEVSMDLGHSWSRISLIDMETQELVNTLNQGPPVWAQVPGVTNARIVLLENPSESPCKVNLRYGRT